MNNFTAPLILVGIYSSMLISIYIYDNRIQTTTNKQLQYDLDELQTELIKAEKTNELIQLKNRLIEGSHMESKFFKTEFFLVMFLLFLICFLLLICGILMVIVISNFIRQLAYTAKIIVVIILVSIVLLILSLIINFLINYLNTKTIVIYYNVTGGLKKNTFVNKDGEWKYQKNYYEENKVVIDKFKKTNNIQATANYKDIYYSNYGYPYVKFTYRVSNDTLKTLLEQNSVKPYMTETDFNKLVSIGLKSNQKFVVTREDLDSTGGKTRKDKDEITLVDIQLQKK